MRSIAFLHIQNNIISTETFVPNLGAFLSISNEEKTKWISDKIYNEKKKCNSIFIMILANATLPIQEP